MKKYFFVFMLVILFKPVQAESLEGKKIFRNEYMEIHIPQFFRIDSVFHFDMGTVYHLFDKKNNDMMWFYNGQSHYNQSFAVDTLTRNFVVNNKIDTIVNIDGQSYRKKIIVLIAKGREHKRFPLIVEFVYNPKFADIPELDTIISSARAIYNNN